VGKVEGGGIKDERRSFDLWPDDWQVGRCAVCRFPSSRGAAPRFCGHIPCGHQWVGSALKLSFILEKKIFYFSPDKFSIRPILASPSVI